ncbi:MAG: uroporphyrinogen-III synthase [Burkholderiales bacterium]|nr:uroporphyrinogen-III synthase [Burkholderiales bacterium]
MLITRPLGQVGSTLERVRAAGHHAEHLPLLALTPLDSPALDAALTRYRQCDVAIFVSANAVEHGLAALASRGIAPAGPKIAAIGAATAQQMRAAGVTVDLVPTHGHDSESLLAHPALHDVAGRWVLIFRGDSESGGRHTLADTLAARGANVVLATCYRRDPAQHAPARLAAIAADLTAGRLNAVQVMSVESLDALQSLLGDLPALHRARVIVPHPRIAEAARSAGFADTVVAELGDEALIAALSIPNS